MTLVKGAYRFLQDPGIREPRYYTMNVSDYVTDDFPATYHWHGKDDITLFALNAAQQEPVLEAALTAHNVPHKYIVYIMHPMSAASAPERMPTAGCTTRRRSGKNRRHSSPPHNDEDKKKGMVR